MLKLHCNIHRMKSYHWRTSFYSRVRTQNKRRYIGVCNYFHCVMYKTTIKITRNLSWPSSSMRSDFGQSIVWCMLQSLSLKSSLDTLPFVTILITACLPGFLPLISQFQIKVLLEGFPCFLLLVPFGRINIALPQSSQHVGPVGRTYRVAIVKEGPCKKYKTCRSNDC